MDNKRMNKTTSPSPDAVYDIFKQLNKIPRPSWHEEKAADFICRFAENLHLEYERDEQNCVVIRKAASNGFENSIPIVILNHMDMVCVAEKGKEFDPLNSPIETYTEHGWMKAKGTSLGADNGIGLAMALAILQDNTILHGPLEVVTTTNEEDGMTGAANLSQDFIHGRKVINLDSEDYDTITIGAAGAYLQFTTFPFTRVPVDEGYSFYQLTIRGGLGGHSGVDINKGRANANKLICSLLTLIHTNCDMVVSEINGGEANNSIAMNAESVVGIKAEQEDLFIRCIQSFSENVKNTFAESDPSIVIDATQMTAPSSVIGKASVDALLKCIIDIPFGNLKMSEQIKDTVETSNNIGMIKMNENDFFISNHTRSFNDEDMIKLGNDIKQIFDTAGARTEVIMSAPAWKSNPDSPFINLAENTFEDVLGFRPAKVAMHFVLEAGYYVQKFPDIEILSIGPKIIEPHSTSERVDIASINNIWKVVIELLYRLK